ncbi:ABC-2 type transport system permease protein/fluoroquinolone transport system permease protein [Anaerovirgula multivorans]|uniref:ABC-2 type transport system permease protein/fluoroquinolone transport system permease protein n=1 Tax=Anaerovirgula multivorans TaxID=312168 RepID=A0A239J5C0_9FIRM|nr:ABC transporter permease [Anaerovirgula multivorans]SNT00872.1 ABC-2 type transport system permease protein/fluoroquinolone transport system permease protein [Anaerovirgula multivorans]
MRRFWSLVKQDTKVMFRNKFHYAIIFLAIFFIILVRFLIPEEMKLTPSELVTDLTPTKFMEKVWRSHDVSDDQFFQTEEALREAMQKNKNSIGIIVKGSIEDPQFTIIQQGHEPESSINYLKTSIDWSLGEAGIIDWPKMHEIQFLREETEPIPLNKDMVPVFLVLEVVMLGFLLIAVMVFQEKREGIIRAYRIAPGGVHDYVLSKAITNVLLSIIYGLLVVIFTLGLRVDYLNLLGLIILMSSFATFLGLIVSVHFRSLSEFLFVAIVLMSLMGLPIGSYFFPTFSNMLVQMVPSYPVLFGVREVLFPTGRSGYLGSLYLSLLIANGIAYAVSYWACKRCLMREVV